MKVETFPDSEAVAQKGAEIIAAEARVAVKARGRFIVAVSGGHTPWQMLRALANEDVPWGVNVVQVDERVAPDGDPDRKTSRTCVRACLSMRRYDLSRSMRCRWKRRIWKSQWHAVPKPSKRSPARRPCSTLFISASAQTATPLPLYREIRF